MRRNMDLVRNILLKVDQSDAPIDMSDLVTPDFDQKAIEYHVSMMVKEAGLLRGHDVSCMEGEDWIELSLTWYGHEFLDSIRDDEIWRQAKAGMSRAGGFSIDLISDLAKGLIKTQIAKHTGITLSV